MNLKVGDRVKLRNGYTGVVVRISPYIATHPIEVQMDYTCPRPLVCLTPQGTEYSFSKLQQVGSLDVVEVIG